MTDDELVERFFPCDRIICGNQPSGHSYDCAADYRHHAKRLASAVREAVLKRVRVCHDCGGCGMRAIFDIGGSVDGNEPCEGCKEFGALGFTLLPHTYEKCQECGGHGYAMFKHDADDDGAFDRCERCHGRGVVEGET